MQLPAPLLRRNPNQHKNQFGHALILAGSARMLGAAALATHAAMRAGAGLVTLGVARTLNLTAQKKIPSVVMTLPLAQTQQQTLSFAAYATIKKEIHRYSVLALGPGLSKNPSTQKLILKIISSLDIPLILDADALNALAKTPILLKKHNNEKILTPHTGEMSRMIGKKITNNSRDRKNIAVDFARTYACTVVLKGHRTIVASRQGQVYVNTTGNVGMATAGSGDVLTGILTAFLAQGIKAFDAAKFAVYLHGKTGDIAAKVKGKASLMATDLIDALPIAMRNC